MPKHPKYNYKIRNLTPGNQTGDSYGITVPRPIADKFKGVNFFVSITDNSIIYESGCAIVK